ncbi:hypothetical protein RFI_32253 [Reticulomyxa filosa]|uniref:Uncharacterized protein n=1 Tax=Reticulomyxa filosa TaxID=46433 RepID=X6LT82_RETFI|nr:hypothetical protein RFI_32253 [Reticulomyxa filosa]|eukprot:ETO05143.1 hypothetical protein RFI_32253 [Reticulomyxa filosa]
MIFHIEQVYLFGKKCLQKYLKQSNGKVQFNNTISLRISNAVTKEMKNRLNKSCKLISIEHIKFYIVVQLTHFVSNSNANILFIFIKNKKYFLV